MRRLLVASLVLAVVAGVPGTVMASTGVFRASGGFSSSLDQQASSFTTTTARTSRTQFRPVPGLREIRICALSQVTATLSAELSGAPAGFQVHVDFGPLMQPGPVRFVPAGPHDSSSFTFVISVAPFENNDHHVFDVEWRSPTGRSTTLERATLNLQFQRGTHMC